MRIEHEGVSRGILLLLTKGLTNRLVEDPKTGLLPGANPNPPLPPVFVAPAAAVPAAPAVPSVVLPAASNVVPPVIPEVTPAQASTRDSAGNYGPFPAIPPSHNRPRLISSPGRAPNNRGRSQRCSTCGRSCVRVPWASRSSHDDRHAMHHCRSSGGHIRHHSAQLFRNGSLRYIQRYFLFPPHAVRNRAKKTQRKEASERRKEAADKREAARNGNDGGDHSNNDEDVAEPSQETARPPRNRVGETGGSSAQDNGKGPDGTGMPPIH